MYLSLAGWFCCSLFGIFAITNHVEKHIHSGKHLCSWPYSSGIKQVKIIAIALSAQLASSYFIVSALGPQLKIGIIISIICPSLGLLISLTCKCNCMYV